MLEVKRSGCVLLIHAVKNFFSSYDIHYVLLCLCSISTSTSTSTSTVISTSLPLHLHLLLYSLIHWLPTISYSFTKYFLIDKRSNHASSKFFSFFSYLSYFYFIFFLFILFITGIAFLTVAKIGFLFSGRVGTGAW